MNNKSLDKTLLVIILALFLIGLTVLYSASTVESYKNFGNTSYYILHQFLYGGLIGLAGMIIFSKIDYHFWEKMSWVLVVAALVLLVAVKLPGLGFSAGGATRWISVGPIFFQPAEVAKFSLIVYLATWLSRQKTAITSFFSQTLPPLIVTGIMAALILWQPDVGSMSILVLTAISMLFVGGLPARHFFWVVLSGLAGLAVIIRLEPYRLERLMTFLDPSHDPQGIGYQINQALLAIGSGGLGGYGYGLSRQKYSYLPEALNDSIFAVMAEELGFIRVVFILGLFVLFVLRGLKVSLLAPDNFGRILGVGICAQLILQVIINIGAITSLLPLTGVPLPLFSYGSTSLIITLCSLGVLLNISRHVKD